MNSWHPSPAKIGPEDKGNFRSDNWAATAISAMDKFSPIKNCLFIKDLDNASNNFCSSRFDLFGKTTLDIVLKFCKGNLSTSPLIDSGISSGSRADLRRGLSKAALINAFLHIDAIVVSAYGTTSGGGGNSNGHGGLQ